MNGESFEISAKRLILQIKKSLLFGLKNTNHAEKEKKIINYLFENF